MKLTRIARKPRRKNLVRIKHPGWGSLPRNIKTPYIGMYKLWIDQKTGELFLQDHVDTGIKVDWYKFEAE
jgi:hypothetical protein